MRRNLRFSILPSGQPLFLGFLKQRKQSRICADPYPELSLLWKAQEPEVRYFYETYASWVFPVFHRDVFQYEQLRDASQVIAHDGTDAPIMSIINSTSILLKANGQLVAAFIVDQATQEIMEQYDALLSIERINGKSPALLSVAFLSLYILTDFIEKIKN